MIKKPRRARLELSGVPDRVAPSTVLSAVVHATNKGHDPWHATSPEGDQVGMVVRWDGVVVANHPLPRAVVNPGETVRIRFVLECPDRPGKAKLEIDMVRYHYAEFANEGGKAIKRTVRVTDAAPDRAGRLWTTAQAMDPWHYVPTRGLSRLADGTSLPVFLQSSKGCRVRDQHDREYVDYSMGWGSVLLGYAHPKVTEAVARFAGTGATLSWPQPVEMEVAEMLVEDFPSAEMVCFGKNGSDVCTFAARIARLATNRKTILFSGYHGWQDFWTEQVAFARTGVVPREPAQIHRFPFHDLVTFEALYREHRDDLAAIFVEPSPWAGDGFGFEPDTDPAFLHTLRRRADECGALLVLDEIVTGYRYPELSAQAAKDVKPDLTCLGKAIASGLPLSALVGRADLFKRHLPQSFYAPTFHNESLSLAAARASIRDYRDEPVAEHVWDYGARLRDGIHELCEQLGVPAKVWGPEFRMNLRFQEDDPDRHHRQRTLYIQELLRAGITTCNAVMLPCYAHDDAALATTLDGIGRALEVVAAARARDDWEERLEIPLLVEP